MKHHERTGSGIAALLLVGSLLVGALAAAPAAAAQMPTEPAEAMRLHEIDVDIEDWAKGPVEYIFLREEEEIWRELSTDEERREFIAWFWERRDEDLRDRTNPFKEGFYVRVAEANKRFRGFPRGWRSDRGRVWIALGQPDSMKGGGLSTVTWTYFTYGGILKSTSNMGEMQVYFAQVDVGKWEIQGGVGPGAWPIYVLRAFEIVNRALIANPSMEWGK